jgi:hypothetical protein
MNQIENVLKTMEGLSYSDWIRLRTATDRIFDSKVSELRKDIQLTDSTKIKKLIQSQFG